jgi:hypothetical protein
MNTPTENAYYELMSSSRMYIRTIETKVVEHEFKITPQIMDEFNNWKIDTLQATDEKPTDLEILEYFKKLSTISSSGGYGSEIKVEEIKLIDYENE